MGDRALVRLHWPVALRPAFDALFGIDDRLGEIVTTASQPALGAIRLAWWREALERLDHAPPPAEPHLQAASVELLSRGVSGASVARIEEGWAALLDEAPDLERVARRGQAIFAIGAALLGADAPGVAEAGRVYALGNAARRGLIAAPALPGSLGGHRFPRALRPLTALARLAARDLRRPGEPEATPARAAALLSHRLFGTISD